MQSAALHAITGGHTPLVLVARPGDETRYCGTLIAACCAAGRAPMVAILGDGASAGPANLSADQRAFAYERESRHALAALGLPAERLLMVGIRDDHFPAGGSAFDRVAEVIGFLTWMRDLNVIVGPGMETRAGRIARAAARHTGLRCVAYGGGPLRLPSAGQRPRLCAARAAYRTLPLPGTGPDEAFALPSTPGP